MPTTTYRWTEFAPAMLLAAMAFFSVSVVQMSGSFGGSVSDLPQVAVIFPPWVDFGDAMARVSEADGRPVRQGLLSNIVIAASQDVGFVTRLYDQGAILVVDPLVLGGCLVGDAGTT